MPDVLDKDQLVGDKQPPFLAQVLVDGKYAPSVTELVKILKKIDLVGAFGEAQFVKEKQKGSLVISFDSLEHSHLFALVLLARGYEKNLFYNSPSQNFFTGRILEDHRIDTNQLSFSEQPDGSRVLGELFLKYAESYEDDRRDKLSDLITGVVREVMPHLAGEVGEFKL